ncbi:baseplate J/gp47 family protein [Paenibacillus chibensis]|uniref:baseplate J/gp47 family protein n=1 Tax=Paenibacillus chibensis TaxID=59846 RepID=UPI0027D841C1|nr:baseplate J/gp47 family protein [Paenibacillus chibensis]
MAYEQQTSAAILDRMLDASPSDIDKRQGSVTNDLLTPAAIELSLAYAGLDTVLQLGFADTTAGEYLDKRAAEYGLTRKPAVKAFGTLTFAGPDGTVIPAGTLASTGGDSPVYFVTKAAAIIAGGTATVAADAQEASAAGNVGIGLVNTLLGDLVGIVAVTNTVNFEGGVDSESDASLLARYIERARRPATSGNSNQYRQWALEIPGVSDAKVYPIWNGPGTVKVVLLDDDKTAPDASVVTAAQTYIDPTQDGTGQGAAPIGAIATVVGAKEVAINVNVDVDWAPGYSSVFTPRVKSAIEAEALTVNSGYGGSIDDTQAGASGGRCVKFTYVTNGNSKATISGETLANMLGKAGQYKIRARVKVSDTTSTTKFFVLSMQNPQTLTPFERYQGSGTPTDDELMFSPRQLSTDWTWVELPFYWDGIQPIELWTGRPHNLIEGVTLWEDQVEFISEDGDSKAPADVQKQVEDGVRAYLKSLAFADPLVRITRIANILLDIPPIVDYRNLTINGGTGNVAIADGEVAVLGTVTIT